MYDSEIREYLKSNFKDKKFADEVVLGRSRIDLLDISSELHGYEIKSDHDNHVRLKKQRNNYNKFLSKITIVIAESKLETIINYVPHFWGVIIVSKKDNLIKHDLLREPLVNPYCDKKRIISVLWRDELIDTLSARHHVDPNGRYSKMQRWKLADLLQKELSLEQTIELVRSCYLNRLDNRNWRS